MIFPGQQFKERIILLFQLQTNIFWVAKNNKIGVTGVKPSKAVYEVAIPLFFYIYPLVRSDSSRKNYWRCLYLASLLRNSKDLIIRQFKKKSKWASLQCCKFWMERDFLIFSLLLDQKCALVYRMHCILCKTSKSHFCITAHGCPLWGDFLVKSSLSKTTSLMKT